MNTKLPQPFDATAVERKRPATGSDSRMSSFRLPDDTKRLLRAKAEAFEGNKTKALIAAIEKL